MDRIDGIRSLLDEIRNYQRLYPELLKCHHFVAALPLETAVTSFEAMVIGLNPGEQENNWDIHPGPTEETIEYDWLDQIGARTPQSNRWRKSAEFFCGSRQIIFTDFFFWSTNNSGAAFSERFGCRFQDSPHLDFCRDINLRLASLVAPKIVVVPGIGHAEFFSRLYGLRLVRSERWSNGHRLIEHYQRENVPWIFTKHWGGAFGFTQDQRERVRQYISLAASGAF